MKLALSVALLVGAAFLFSGEASPSLRRAHCAGTNWRLDIGKCNGGASRASASEVSKEGSRTHGGQHGGGGSNNDGGGDGDGGDGGGDADHGGGETGGHDGDNEGHDGDHGHEGHDGHDD